MHVWEDEHRVSEFSHGSPNHSPVYYFVLPTALYLTAPAGNFGGSKAACRTQAVLCRFGGEKATWECYLINIDKSNPIAKTISFLKPFLRSQGVNQTKRVLHIEPFIYLTKRTRKKSRPATSSIPVVPTSRPWPGAAPRTVPRSFSGAISGKMARAIAGVVTGSVQGAIATSTSLRRVAEVGALHIVCVEFRCFVWGGGFGKIRESGVCLRRIGFRRG